VAIGDRDSIVPAEVSGRRIRFRVSDPTKGAFFWLCAFFVMYCTRPQDFIPGAQYIPVGKITAIMAMWGLFNAVGRTKRKYKDLPKEATLLLVIIGLFYVGAILSPIWKVGALTHTMDFSKVYISWVLVFLLVTTFDRLRKIVFIQAFSMILICTIAIVKGHDVPRLDSVLGGIYGNSNDLAFAIVLSLPLALAFLVTAKSAVIKVFWLGGMLVMLVAIFLTASRAGFINLVISFSVALYYFGIKGRRFYLIVAAGLIGAVVMGAFGGKLYDRFAALNGGSATEQSAYGSYEQRKYLMDRAVDAIEHYPIFGLGCHDFPPYSLVWHDVHMTYLQIGAEGGIPVLVLYLMFFGRGFMNLKILHKKKDLDSDTVLFVGALHSSLVGFIVGAFFAPEAYQGFPYLAVALTAALLQTVKEHEQERGSGAAPAPPEKPRHFLEVYANHGTTGAVSPVR
jgi:O-antigen ligase